MVFTTNSLQGQSPTHRRHLFESLLHQLHPQKPRTRFRTQASDDKSSALAGKPSLAGPPKRPARPAPAPPQLPPRARDTPVQRDNGNGGPRDRRSFTSQQNPSSSNQQGQRNGYNGGDVFDRKGKDDRRDRRDVSRPRPASQQPPSQPEVPRSASSDAERLPQAATSDTALHQQPKPQTASPSQSPSQVS